ncbi:protein FRG2 [Camelus dromedarius]|uniref:protein FRG2 n=1 Tax=Camelus dromedarius TaxID=9838 RepID=UPI00311A2592
MESGTEVLHPHSPSNGHPTDQPTFQQSSVEERASDAEEKIAEENGKTFSFQLDESQAERPGSEPKSDGEDNANKTEPDGGNSCIAPSDSEGSSSPERKINSRDSTYERIGASPNKRSMTSEKKKQTASDAGLGSESGETRDARPRGPQGRRRGRSKRPRSGSPGDQPPPLRKSLVTSLRSMSEAIFQNIVQVYNQQGDSPPSWEELAQLRGRLCAAVQTFYAVADQAAYVFPAESWLVPAPLPGPWGPARDGGAGPCSEDAPPLP